MTRRSRIALIVAAVLQLLFTAPSVASVGSWYSGDINGYVGVNQNSSLDLRLMAPWCQVVYDNGLGGIVQVSSDNPLPTTGGGGGGGGTVQQGARAGSAQPWLVDLEQILGAAPSASNPMPNRLTNGSSYYDARDIRFLDNSTDSVSCSVSNFPATVSVTQSTSPWVVSGTVAATQSGAWSIGRTWNLSFASDQVDASGSSVSVSNFPATQSVSGTVTANQGTNPWTVSGTVNAAQSGTWTTGRTWSLLNTTDSVNAVQSGTWTVQQGSAPWSVSQSGTWDLNNITGTVSLPTGASTAANQATGNSSLATIATQQTSGAQKSQRVDGSGNVSPAADVATRPLFVELSDGANPYDARQISSVPAVQNKSASGTLTTTGDTVSVDTNGMSTVFMEITTSGFTGSVALEGQGTGTAYYQTYGTIPFSTLLGTCVGACYMHIDVGGWTNFRARAVGWSSGTATVKLTSSTGLATLEVHNLTPGNLQMQAYGNVNSGATDSGAPVKTGGVYNSNGITLSAGQRGDNQLNSEGDQTVAAQNLEATGTSGSLNAVAIPSTGSSIDATNFQCLKFQVTGTYSGTLTMQGSMDNSTWKSVDFLDQSVTTTLSQSTVVNTAGESLFMMPVTQRYYRFIMTAYTSGTATVPYQFSTLPCTFDPTVKRVNVANNLTLAAGLLTTGATTTDVASAARTTTFTSSTINTAQGAQSDSYEVSVTAVSGTTPTMDCALQQSWDTSTTWFDVYHWERITATGQYITPQLPTVGNRTRYVCTIGGTTPSFTFSIVRVDHQNMGRLVRRFFDRTINPNSANSTSASWFVEDVNDVEVTTNISACVGLFPTFVLQFSEDNVNWASSSVSLGLTANGTSLSSPTNQFGKFARILTSVAGSGCSLGYVSLSGRGN